MNAQFSCRICCRVSERPEQVRVPGATRDVQSETYTVWRCRHCFSLNALEPIDFDRVYRRYPIQQQRYDVFARLLFAKRLAILRRAGLEQHHRVLDYGCGSGHFVRYLQEQGYHCLGYDPYNPRHADVSLLEQPVDMVTCQDVLEHVDEPAELLCRLGALVVPAGRLVIGTPYADHVDLHDTIDQLGVLHQPFHRFVISRRQVPVLFSLPGWSLEQIIDACYLDTVFPFVNARFLFELFKSGDGSMDFAFEPLPMSHFLRHPALLFWGLFGRVFARRQDFFAVMRRLPASAMGKSPAGRLADVQGTGPGPISIRG